MTRRVMRTGWIRCLLAGLLMVVATDVYAACETGGVSGTGFSGEGGESGTGTGGTGLREPGGTGTGGTGLGDPEEGGTGTGGTGILGVITGFGSVCVNGQKVEYDESTRIEVDGRSATTEELAVGQLVRITTPAGRPRHAREIRVQNLLVGPIDRLEPGGRALWVMGQRVALRDRSPESTDPATRGAGNAPLTAGERVAVSGFRRSDGVVAATRVVRSPRERDALATAVARRAEDGALYVGNVRAEVDASGRSGSEQLEGRRVRVRGSWNPETSTLEAVRVEKADSLDRSVHRVSLQGYASRGERAHSLRIGDIEIDARSVSTGLEGLPSDSRLRVEGVVEKGRRVRADRIVIEERGRPDAFEGRDSEDLRDRSSRGGRSERSDRSGRSDRSDRSDRPERPERVDRPDREGRSGRSERSGR